MNYKYLITLMLLLSCVTSCATPPTNSSPETTGAADAKAKLEAANTKTPTAINNGSLYQPKYSNAKKDGYYTDIEFDDDTKYTGYFKNGVRHGNGVLYYKLTREYYIVQYDDGKLIYKSFSSRE